jgi:soluble lytic murein transglycosylase
MSINRKTPLLLALAVVAVSGGATVLRGMVVSSYFAQIARCARSRRGWPALRRYAQATRNAQDRSLAYFVLGYREYQASRFSSAAADLRRASRTSSAVADWAEYYQALSDQSLKDYAAGIQVIEGLRGRHPESPLRIPGIALEAGLLVQAGQPQRAIALISGAPGALASAASLEALAKAYGLEGNAGKSAKTYETLYCDFPLTPQGDDAGRAMDELRATLGAAFPEVSDQRKTERLAKLLQAGEFSRALNGYNQLLQAEPHSPMADEWRLGRARSLLGSGHYDGAAEDLLSPIQKNSSLDAVRLALLVHIYERADDAPSMLNTLNLLYQQHPHSPSYADALFYAGDYFSRNGFWQTATRYYEPVTQNFPGSLWGSQAGWWVTWYRVLDGNGAVAATALEDYLRQHPDSPHLPDALYWLARIRQQQGAALQAQGLYRAVVEKFPNSYYGYKARSALASLHASNASLPGRDDAPPPEMPLGIAARPPSPPLWAEEERPEITRLLTPAATLAELGLRQLASRDLASMAASHGGDPEYFLAVARLWSEQENPAAAILAAARAVPNYPDYSFGELPREVWNLLYPHPYWSSVRLYARANGLSPYLVMALIRQESAFNPRALSAAGARGLMQMMPSTAAYHVRSRWRRRRAARLLYDPRYNLRMSSRYLAALLHSFNRDTAEAVAAYNAGDSRVAEWLTNGKFPDADEFVESIPYADTRVYVESVLRDAAIYRALLTGNAKFQPPDRLEN